MSADHPVVIDVQQSGCAAYTDFLNDQSYSRWLTSRSTCNQGWPSQRIAGLISARFKLYAFLASNVHAHTFAISRVTVVNRQYD